MQKRALSEVNGRDLMRALARRLQGGGDLCTRGIAVARQRACRDKGARARG